MIYGKYIAALCIPRIHDVTNYKLIASLGERLNNHGVRLMVFSTPSELYWNSQDEMGEKAVFELINYSITDVVIVHTEAFKDKKTINGIIGCAEAHNISVITIGAPRPDCSGISFDYRLGFEKVVRHILIDHNVTDFHVIAGADGNSFSDERVNVIREVSKELDIPFGDEDISYGHFWSGPTEEAVERLFVRRKKFPRAIICINDAMALTALKVVTRHGLRVPQDVIITGFDGINETKYCSPGMTTCLCSSDRLAESLADMAYSLINGGEITYKLVSSNVLPAVCSRGLVVRSAHSAFIAITIS